MAPNHRTHTSPRHQATKTPSHVGHKHACPLSKSKHCLSRERNDRFGMHLRQVAANTATSTATPITRGIAAVAVMLRPLGALRVAPTAPCVKAFASEGRGWFSSPLPTCAHSVLPWKPRQCLSSWAAAAACTIPRTPEGETREHVAAQQIWMRRGCGIVATCCTGTFPGRSRSQFFERGFFRRAESNRALNGIPVGDGCCLG